MRDTSITKAQKAKTLSEAASVDVLEEAFGRAQTLGPNFQGKAPHRDTPGRARGKGKALQREASEPPPTPKPDAAVVSYKVVFLVQLSTMYADGN